MPETRSPLFRLAAVAAIIAAVVPVGACGSSPERASTAPAPTTASAPSSASATAAPAPPAAPRRGKDYVAGTVASVSGTTVQVSQAGGTATVNLSSAISASFHRRSRPTQLSTAASKSARLATASPAKTSSPEQWSSTRRPTVSARHTRRRPQVRRRAGVCGAPSPPLDRAH